VTTPKRPLASNPCVACNERGQPWTCDVCRREVVTYCRECHAEIRHGIIGPPQQPPMARHPQRPGKFHEDEDMNRRADE